MTKAREARPKKVIADDTGLGSFIVFEREAGTGTRDTVTIKGQRYMRSRDWIVNAKGERVRKITYGRTEAELNRKVKRLLATPAANLEASKLSVQKYFKERFLPGVKSEVRSTTYASYENAVEKRIIPGLGKTPFQKLAPDNVRAWIKEMAEAGLGQRSDQIAVAILKRGYKRALEDGLIAADPIGHVKLPKAKMKPQYVPSLKETIHFLSTVREKRPEHFALLFCAISLGMRESELFGLTWDRVDFETGRVRVVKQAGLLADGKTLGQVDLKTRSSERTLYLDRLTAKALEMQKGRDARLVFPGPRGGYFKRHTMSATVFPSLLEAAGLPTDGTLWFHLLRHAAQSMLSAANVSSPKIDKWAGHTTGGIAGKYILIHDEELEGVAGVMERLLEPVFAEKG
jgi:integrase